MGPKSLRDFGGYAAETTQLQKSIVQESRQQTKIDEARATMDRWSVVTVNQDVDVTKLAAILRGHPQVEIAEPVHKVQATTFITETGEGSGGGGCPVSDSFYCRQGTWGQAYLDQWNLRAIDVEGAWPKATASNGATVAVIDTGVFYLHPELASRMWKNSGESGPGQCTDRIDNDHNGYVDDCNGWDFSYNDNDPFDLHGHGTHVAGTIAALTDNGFGVAGIARNVKIMAVQGLDANGGGYDDKLALAILYAARNGARVINMSWGGSGTSTLISNALDFAHSLGVLEVAAAGNDGGDVAYAFPANDPNVTPVAAWGPSGTRASFSNYGKGIDVTAPGVDILSLRGNNTDFYCRANSFYCSPANSKIVRDPTPPPSDPSGTFQYYRSNGTSMAAPHVAGVAALLKAQYPALDQQTFEVILRTSATDVMTPGWDQYTGYGLLNASQAMTKASDVILHPKPELRATVREIGLVNPSTVWATIDLFNEGNAVAYDVDYRVVSGGAPSGPVIEENTVSYIPIGWSRPVSVHFSTQAFLDWAITVTVDYQSTIPEFDETNNSASATYDESMPGYWPAVIDSWTTPVLADVAGHGNAYTVLGGLGWMGVLHEQGGYFSYWLLPDASERAYYDPVVAELDPDSPWREIIVSTNNGMIYIYHLDGTLWRSWDIGSQPATQVSVADINGDGSLEIIEAAGGWYQPSTLYVWHADGTPVAGWPLQLGDVSLGYRIAVDDIDPVSPGKELISAEWTSDGINPWSPRVMAWHADGTPVAGWPQFSPDDYGWLNAIAIGDIDHDGRKDIVSNDWNRLFAWHADGTPVSGFPASVSDAQLTTSPVVADINGDGSPEILIGDSQGRVRAWQGDGSEASWWPATAWDAASSVVSVKTTDFFNDQRPEIVVSLSSGKTAILATSSQQAPLGTPLPRWPKSFGDAWTADISGDGAPDVLTVGSVVVIPAIGFRLPLYDAWYIMGSSGTAASGTWPVDGHDYQRTSRFDITPPDASIASPAAGSTIGGAVTLQANAFDWSGLTAAKFLVDGVEVGNGTKYCKTGIQVCQFTFRWNSKLVSNGTHLISSVVADAYGNTTTTAGQSIIVGNVSSGTGGGPRVAPAD